MDNEIRHALFRFDDFGPIVAAFTKAEADASVGCDGQVFLDDDFAFGEVGEVVEALHQMLAVAIDVKVIGIDGVDDADVGVELEERMVELVGFHHDDEIFLLAKQQVAVEVVGDAADEGGGAPTAFVEDVGHHSGGSGLTVSASHRDGEVPFRDLAQGRGAFHNLYIVLPKGFKLLQVFRNCWCIYDEVDMGGQQVGSVFIMDGHALVFELSCQWGRGTIVAGHGVALAVVVAG